MRGKAMRRKLIGIALHLPIGLAIVALAYINSMLALIFALGFLSYEITQEWRQPGKGWYDIAGALWGIAIGGGIWVIVAVVAGGW